MLYNTLRQYEYIVAIAKARSLTQAAVRLNVSQPSLSVAITRVEHRLGAPIFVRGKGAALEITPYGHRIVQRAKELLAMAAKIEQKHDISQPFVLGCFADIAPWYLAPALHTLRGQFPDTTFQGREGRFADIAQDLAEGRMDAAISYDIGFEGNYLRRKIADIAPVAFLSVDHPLAAKSGLTLKELIPYPMILFSENLSEGFMRTLFQRVNLSPIIGQRVTTLEMMRSFAAHGAGIGISYSRPAGDTSYDGKPLVTIPIATPEATASINLVWSSLRRQDSEFENILKTLTSSHSYRAP